MKRTAWGLMACLVAFGSESCKGDAPAPTVDALKENEEAFFELMEGNDFANERILEKIDDNKPVAELDRYLDMMDLKMRQSRDLRIHADPELEKKLDAEFDRFLSDLAESRKKDWAKDGKALWKTMQSWCTRCHDLFEED